MNTSLDGFYDLLDYYEEEPPKVYSRHVWADFGKGQGGVTYKHFQFRITYTAYFLNGHMENALNADTTRVIVDKIAFNFARIYNKLVVLHPEYEPLQLSAYINNIEPFIYDRVPVLNVDYSLAQNGQSYKLKDDCKRLLCTWYDLEVGDVLSTGHKIATSDDRNLTPFNSQGYFHYELTDGLKYRQFLQCPQRVAIWVNTRKAWLWYGYKDLHGVNIRKETMKRLGV